MSFLDSIKGLFRKSFNPAIFGFFAPTSMPAMGEKEQLKAYRGWVYACVNAIAQPIADIDIKLEKKTKDGWQEVDQNPALDILHNVNDYTSYQDLLYGTQAFIELHGNAFWYLPKSKGGTIAEIWPLDPTRTHVVKSRKTFIEGYVYQNEKGDKVPFPPDEIIHFKTFNPRDPYRGLGTVQAAALAIDTDTYASEWQRNFFGNSAMPSGILATEGKLSDEQYQRIKANWSARYGGVQNAHKMAILEGGLKWTPLSPTSKEMEFTQSRKDIRDEILGIFRVPKVVLGITEDVNYASAAASEYVYNKFVIKPKMKFLVGKLNEFYLPLWGLDVKQYRFTFTDPVPENEDQKRLERESGIRNYYLTPNEAREQIGLEPIEGGDTLYLPMMVTPMGAPKKEEPEDTSEEEDPKEPKTAKKFEKKTYTRKQAAKEPAYIDEQTEELHAEYLGLNAQLKELILDRLSQKGARNAIMKEWLLHKEDSLIRFVFASYKDWVGLVLNASQEGLKRIFAQAGKDGLAEVSVDMDFDLNNPRAVAWIEDHALEDTESYTDTMKEEITAVLQVGIDEGRSVQSIAEDIEAFFDATDDWRAMRIARTETITAYAAGNLEGYKQSGVVAGKSWLADSEACPICVTNAEAGVIGLDETFPSGDLGPAGHPQCECSLQPVVKANLD